MSEEIREQMDTADGGGDLYDVDSIASMFAEDEPGEGEGGEESGEGAEPVEAETPEAAEGGEQTPPAEEPELEVPMPEGWEDAVWQGLAPEVRNTIHAREQAHAQAMAQAQQERQALEQKQEQFTLAANAQLQQALAAMKQVVEGEYGSLDWNALAQSDPATYVRLQQAYNQRMAAIQQIQQNVAAQMHQYESARAAEEQQSLLREFAALQPELKAMMGAGFEGKKFTADLSSYLKEQGCPPEVINGLTRGYEVKLAAKAMLYDRLQAQRAKAAAKVAEAPKVQAPRGALPADNGDRVAKARAVLTKNPNSVDALASLLEATM